VGRPITIESDSLSLDVVHAVEEVELHNERAPGDLDPSLIAYLRNDLARGRLIPGQPVESRSNLDPLL
jgi:hypothetical protein